MTTPQVTALEPCPFCKNSPGQKIGPPAMARCITDGCRGKELAAVSLDKWNALSLPHGAGEADGRVPDREIFWLVERVGHQQYVKDRSQLPGLTDDPWRAARFATERAAHDFWLQLATLRDECKPVEHLFVNKDAPSPVLPPSGVEGLAIQRLRAAVSGDDFAWEVNRGNPFDDVQVLLDEYDRLRALSASVALEPNATTIAALEELERGGGKIVQSLPSPALDPGTVTACAKVAENFYNITSTDAHALEFGKLVASQIAGGIRALLASQCTPRTLDPVTVVEAIERALCSFACGKDCERGGNRGDIGLGPCDECTLDFWRSNERKAIRALLASPAPTNPEGKN